MNDVTNYRGISFGNVLGKLLAEVPNERLSNWVNENSILSEFQCGFCKGYSTVDSIFSLMSIIIIKWNEGPSKIYFFLVDFM